MMRLVGYCASDWISYRDHRRLGSENPRLLAISAR
jgi:hypothetical protein